MERRSRILVVDDTPANVRILNETLRDTYDISVATNGRIALDLIHSQGPPDLILLDVMMPEMDGYEVCRRLKEDPDTRSIPVVFITAMSEEEDETRGLGLGAVDYITKPFSSAIVKARVHNHIALAQAYEVIRQEKEKSEQLLLNILPAPVAEDLKRTGNTTPHFFDNVTVCFSDLVGFTALASEIRPEELIDELNDIFTAFDNIVEVHQCERIKTIGDAYLAVSGMPDPNQNHATNMVRAALRMVDYLEGRNADHARHWEVRIGIHTGGVVGGVVGVKKYIYDVFGDTINTASRMQSNSAPMKVNVSETTHKLVQHRFHFVDREQLAIKGKGNLRMFFVDGEED